MPDVFVRKVDKRWQVEISPTGVPRLSVNQQYANLLRGNGDHSALRTQLQEARWLIRSLEIRNETLLKVASCIVARQTEFLEHGDEAMKPMVLRDVADEIGMHESTISRVTTNKYMHTPRGVFEFKYFFSSTCRRRTAKTSRRPRCARKSASSLAAENPAKPLSDSKLANLLADEGIKVARRTVAKYRESMNISSSSERRQRAHANSQQNAIVPIKTATYVGRDRNRRRPHKLLFLSEQTSRAGSALTRPGRSPYGQVQVWEATYATKHLRPSCRRNGFHARLCGIEKSNDWSDTFDLVSDVHCILTVEKLRHKAEAKVNVNGGTIYAEETEEDMYAAIDGLVDKLDRQVRKHKEKLVDHHARDTNKRNYA